MRRSIERAALTDSITGGGQTDGFSHQAKGLLVHDAESVRIRRRARGARVERLTLKRRVGLGRKRAEGGEATREDRHRMRRVVEMAEEALDVGVQRAVVEDLGAEELELRLRRKLAVDDQVGRLEEGRVLGQLLDRIAAVCACECAVGRADRTSQDAALAVDVGDLRADDGRLSASARQL